MHTAQWTSRIRNAYDASVANSPVVARLQADVGAQVGADVALCLWLIAVAVDKHANDGFGCHRRRGTAMEQSEPSVCAPVVDHQDTP